MEDFFISMSILRSGYKSVLNPEAICYEDVSNNAEEEVKRKTRIQAGNLQNLSVFWPLLFRPNALAFCFWSHKVFRWFTPLFTLLAFVANLFLLQNGIFFCVVFGIQCFGILSLFIDAVLQKIGVHLRMLRYVAYFYRMNFALVKGFMMYFKGIKTSAWQPTARA